MCEGILLCQAVPLSDLVIEAYEIEALAGIQVRVLSCRILNLEPLTHDVTALTLGLMKGRGNLEFRAGQYVDLLLWDNSHRSYSIVSSSKDAGVVELHIRRIPGGRFSEQEFGAMKEQGLLSIIGPLGTFFLRDDPRPTIFVGVGTGFAPIAAMVEDLHRRGIQRQIQFYWGCIPEETCTDMNKFAFGNGKWVLSSRPYCRNLIRTGTDGVVGCMKPCWQTTRTCQICKCMLVDRLEWLQPFANLFPNMVCISTHCIANHLTVQWIDPASVSD